MKIAILAQRGSIHTIRWVNALAERGHDVHLISSTQHGEPLNSAVSFHALPTPPPAGYFLNARPLKRLLSQLQPDVLNTHFASGYGTLARLSNFRPNMLSVWGSDVYDFPDKSPLHKKLIRDNLKNAAWVCSTSRVMAERTRQLYPVEKLNVIPFGIDTTVFAPQSKPATPSITIGTVKSLAPKYGIDLLIKAFAELRSMLQPTQPEAAAALRLLIVGGGPEEAALKQVVVEAGVAGITTFTGKVPHSEVPSYLNQLDIYVALSRCESFGVAILEASSCALPVVVANVGGLPEVVKNHETGLVVPREDPVAAAAALKRLAVDLELRQSMGSAGRQHVLASYTWEQSVAQMEQVLSRVTKRGR